jgi:hypothetical protein
MLGPLERANLNGQPMSAILIPEIRLRRREVTGKYTIKIVIKHAQT